MGEKKSNILTSKILKIEEKLFEQRLKTEREASLIISSAESAYEKTMADTRESFEREKREAFDALEKKIASIEVENERDFSEFEKELFTKEDSVRSAKRVAEFLHQKFCRDLE